MKSRLRLTSISCDCINQTAGNFTFKSLRNLVSLLLLFILMAGTAVEELSAFQGGDPNKFLTLRDEIRQLERDISKKFGSIPLGFPKEQEVQLKEIEVLRERIAEIRTKLDETAIESYTADPTRNPQARTHIIQMALAKLEGRGAEQPFDPARTYELVTLVGKGGNTSTDILAIAFQACLAMQDFQRADRIIQRLKTMNVQISEAELANFEKLKKSWEKELTKREQEQEADNLPRVQLETEYGNMVIELFEDDSPQTVANFIYLVEQGFYDGLAFHDVKPGDTARAGCPNSDGTGEPGYRIANEPTTANSRRFFAGTIGMQHEGVNTAGSQFFFTYQPKPTLDLKFVAFGRIVEGLETLYQLPRTELKSSQFSAVEPPKITRASVLRKRDHVYEPTKITTLPKLGSENESPLALPPSSGSSVPDVAPPDDDGKGR